MSRIIIDVREPSEFVSGHVEGAINIPSGEIMSGSKQLEDISKDTELVLYCRSGARSGASLLYLQKLGFSNLVNGVNQGVVQGKYLS